MLSLRGLSNNTQDSSMDEGFIDELLAREHKRDVEMEALQHRMDELLQYLQPSSKKSSRKGDGSSTSSDGNSVKSGRKTREDNTSSSDEDDPRRRRRRGKHKDDDRSLRLDVPEFNGVLILTFFLIGYEG